MPNWDSHKKAFAEKDVLSFITYTYISVKI